MDIQELFNGLILPVIAAAAAWFLKPKSPANPSPAPVPGPTPAPVPGPSPAPTPSPVKPLDPWQDFAMQLLKMFLEHLKQPTATPGASQPATPPVPPGIP